MFYEVKKNNQGGVELLPEIIDTPLWALIDPDKVYRTKRSDRLICELYMVIRERENYFQEETPTAFGNPVYSRRCGVVEGYLGAMEASEHKENEQIVIRRNSDGRKLLAVDVLTRSERYYESIRDNRKTLAALGF